MAVFLAKEFTNYRDQTPITDTGRTHPEQSISCAYRICWAQIVIPS